MSVIGSNILAGASGQATGYNVERSLRFNSSDSAFLSRVPSTAGNRKTWTWAGWVKRASIGSSYEILFSARAGTSSNRDYLTFQSDQLVLTCVNSSGTTTANIQTTALFRDPGAWYHLVLAVDTTQVTAASRVRMYVNGTEITVFSLASYPSQNTDLSYNDAQPHTIGQSATGTAFSFSGYLADIHFIDGQALTPSSFTEVSATTGQLIPKAYTGSYGTNGFHLDFADNSAATAAALGKDTSGNGNNWTPNNLSVTAGAGNDSLVDSPTNYGADTGAGGEVRGNYCTWNPLANSSTLTNGNLDCANSAASWQTALSTIAVSSGKWFAELTLTTHSATNSGIHFGIAATSYSPAAGNYLGDTSTSYAYRSVIGEATGSKVNSNSFTTYGAVCAQGNVMGLALDLDAGTLTFYKNGVSQGQAFSGVSGTFVIALSVYLSAGSVNFGQRPFAYTAPSGFKALCTANLPTPTIANGATAMDVKLYTGNGSTQTISGLSFEPDLVWIKERNAVADHALYDIVRGTQNRLESNNTDAAVGSDNGLTAFNSNGFALGSLAQVNTTNDTYVAWCWDAGSFTTSNPDGSITSQVRANASAGFSVVTYTGNGTAGATVGHGLGVAPSFVIIKGRATTYNWNCYHKSIDATAPQDYFISMNLTDSRYDYTVANLWNRTQPGSTVFTLGSHVAVNTSSSTYVTYCFAPVAGYSSMGSYTGNGSADGPFVFLGFRPALVMVKMSSSTGNWTILDDKREGYNVDNDPLYPNLSNAEGTTDLIDITSNGFKVLTTDATFNTNAGTYIYAAWASSPFAYSRAR